MEHKQNIMNRPGVLITYDCEFVADFFNVFIGEMRRINLAYELPEQYYQPLSTEQINWLGAQIPDLFATGRFVEKWFECNYGKKYEFLLTKNRLLTFSEKEEKRRIL